MSRRARRARARAAGDEGRPECGGRVVYLSQRCANNARYLIGLAHPEWPPTHAVAHDDHWHLVGLDVAAL